MVITESDIIAWYDFEDGSGTTLTDSSTNGNDGTISAGSGGWVSGGPTNIPGGFNFASSEIELPTACANGIFDGGASIIIVFENDTQTFGRLYDDKGANNGIWIRSDIDASSNSLRVVQDFSTSDGQWSISPTVSHGTTYFLGITYDASSTTNNAAFFFDGSAPSVSELESPSGSAVNNSTSIPYLGNRDSSNSFFDGKMYQVIIFNREITQTEFDSIRNGGDGITYTNFFSADSPSNALFFGGGL